jgi:phospho-N-acetylmuramoyl-pentapeptide-transferase
LIPWLVPWLTELWQPFQALGYITVRAGMAAGVAFAAALFLGKPLIAKLRAAGVGEAAGIHDSPRIAALYKEAGKEGTPTMGGVFWVAAVLLSTLLFARTDELLVLLGAVLLVGMGAIGFLDDWVKFKSEDGRNGLSRKAKFFSSLLLAGWVAGMLWFLGRESGRAELGVIYFPLLKGITADPALLGWVGLLLFVLFESFVILATAHAVNVTDGLDGLAAGSALPAFGALCVAVYAVGHAGIAEYLHLPFLPGAGEVAVMGGALLGATLGFLWFNSHPAEVFMGDSGSLPMGAMIAWLAIVSRQEFALPLLAGVFVLEVSTSLFQILWFKMTGGKRLFPIAPIHHCFQGRMAESKLVVRFWILAAVLSTLGLLALKVR